MEIQCNNSSNKSIKSIKSINEINEIMLESQGKNIFNKFVIIIDEAI